MRRLVILSFFLLLSFISFAQGDYMLEIKNENKYIYVDKLHLPSTVSVQTVLASIPELHGMPGSFIYDNYEFKLDGVLLRDNPESTLTQISLDDVEKIEIEESSSSSYQSNGQSGSVNVILKRPAQRGFSGSASLFAGYLTAVAPGFKLNYKGEEYTLIALANASYQDVNNIVEHRMQPLESGTKREDETFDNSLFSQFTRVYIDYSPSKNNVWIFKVGENYNKSDTKSDVFLTQPAIPTNYTSYNSSYSTSFTGETYARYKHFFKDASMLLAHLEYRYTTTKRDLSLNAPLYYDQFDRTKNNTSVIFSKLEYEMHPISPLMVKFGTKYTFNFTRSDLYDFLSSNISVKRLVLNDNVIDGKTNNLIPYLEAAWSKGYDFFKICAEYQFFEYNLSEAGIEKRSQSNSNFTGKIIGGVQMSDNQHLRLVLSRNLNRPSNQQIFPIIQYNYSKDAFYTGKASLKPIVLNQALLNYITNFQWGNHKLTVNACGGYIHSKDLIQTYLDKTLTVEGKNVPIYSYKNLGKSNIWNANLYTNYNFRKFSLCLSGNLFNNSLNVDGKKSNYNYYTVVINPSVSMNGGWNAMCSFNYTSSARVADGEKSRDIMGYANLTKVFGAFEINAWGYIPLMGEKRDITYGQYGNSERSYYTSYYGGGLGFRYSF